MLTKSGHPLSPQLYSLIYIHLSRRDLVQVLRVNRALFEATIPHVWREVGIVPLIRLLASYVPSKLTDRYFDRLYVNGRIVETLDIRSNDFGDSYRPVLDLPQGEGAIAKFAAEHSYNFLPNLKSASILLSPISTSSNDCVRAWAINLIPTTLRNLEFRPSKDYQFEVLQTLTNRCQNLARLEYRMPQLEYWDPWAALCNVPPPQELTELSFECFCVNKRALVWISKLPNLQSLKLGYIPSRQPPELKDISDRKNTKYPNSFKKLSSLSIDLTQRGLQELLHLWGSPIVKYLTSVTITSFNAIGSRPSLIGQFFTVLVAASPSVSHIEISEGAIDLDTSLHQAPTSVLANLGALRLRVLKIRRFMTVDTENGILQTIGSLWPELKELILEGTVIELRELLQVSVHIPKLHLLQICIPVAKSSPEPLSDVLRDCVPSTDALRNLAFLPKLVVDFYPNEAKEGVWSYDLQDQDFLARTLVEISSELRITRSCHSIMRIYFRERVSWYLSAKNSELASETQ